MRMPASTAFESCRPNTTASPGTARTETRLGRSFSGSNAAAPQHPQRWDPARIAGSALLFSRFCPCNAMDSRSPEINRTAVSLSNGILCAIRLEENSC